MEAVIYNAELLKLCAISSAELLEQAGGPAGRMSHVDKSRWIEKYGKTRCGLGAHALQAALLLLYNNFVELCRSRRNCETAQVVTVALFEFKNAKTKTQLQIVMMKLCFLQLPLWSQER